MGDPTRKEGGEKLVELLEGTYGSDEWQFKITEALKKFGVSYEKYAPSAKFDDLTSAWDNYFVLALEKLVRDLPDNELEKVNEAIEELEREDIVFKAKEYGGRVIFPTAENVNNKRPVDEQVEEENPEVQDPATSTKRAKTDKSAGFTFKTDGAYKVRITDSEGGTSTKLDFKGHGPVTVTVCELDAAPAAAGPATSARSGSAVKKERSA